MWFFLIQQPSNTYQQFGTCTLDYHRMMWFRADLEISENKLFQNRAVWEQFGRSQSSSLEGSKCSKRSLGPWGFGSGLPEATAGPLSCSWHRQGHWRCHGKRWQLNSLWGMSQAWVTSPLSPAMPDLSACRTPCQRHIINKSVGLVGSPLLEFILWMVCVLQTEWIQCVCLCCILFLDF